MNRFIALFALLLAVAPLQARKATEVAPLLIGMKTPKVNVVDESGATQYLPSLLKEKRTALIFYRGGWCPYCSKHLQELAQIEQELIDLGYQIVAISPDSPEMLNTVEKDADLPYQLFSDSSFEAAEAFGIDFTLDKATLLKYKAYGIDLEKNSGGKNKNRLPVPAVFLIGPKNTVEFSYVNPDYSERISGDLILAVAKTLANKE
ncbi:peroxiredoxin-like family protein [Pelagicoccus sp. SDUM812003]|uniref:peroxiredoxin-like family protein n=1 Tax=Pelagicoccus sp. SDUM812003 TaxID=3041267 RepID=UPI00280F2024|nr:peroxiredoxin-like family protein [Pelagicoccus sp. SDUM812003]MDQ8202110.1 peroxiredoxin-like family protein [Pelagicoccus sp. SDUM812003]